MTFPIQRILIFVRSGLCETLFLYGLGSPIPYFCKGRVLQSLIFVRSGWLPGMYKGKGTCWIRNNFELGLSPRGPGAPGVQEAQNLNRILIHFNPPQVTQVSTIPGTPQPPLSQPKPFQTPSLWYMVRVGRVLGGWGGLLGGFLDMHRFFIQ